MASGSGRLGDRLHGAVAVLTLWLLLTSPWVAMLRRISAGAGWIDWAHVVLGAACALLGLAYAWTCVRDGRWRLFFPWFPPLSAAVASDLADLLHGRRPASEAGGLFGLIEGLLLVALLVTALTGVAWYFAQGADAALALRGQHIVAVRALLGLLVLHVVTVSLHLLEFVRD